ncbi:hypothetical protein RQM47_01770 [Rubrivirga sp. S365]|uniref:Cbb3-type cytochrome oxidase component FixQ n=1 Tax=Rubrivirga litoralis TaxID=3075598 RepID=A0ABU3BPB0_9BACT|nr:MULTISPECIES: hypothetical protein [unclassified Rubrivirga]MDT0631125.1 hypothetical protein [Rubrivirga sp. F394]MDT7855362.1 hypothetical protein [Rubrivirga sp. S365]
MDTQIYLVVAVTFVGFVGLAFILLYPVYRFLRREERVADEWTQDAVARRQRPDAGKGVSGDGAPTDPVPTLSPPRRDADPPDGR